MPLVFGDGRFEDGLIKHAASNTPGWTSNLNIKLTSGLLEFCQADKSEFNGFQPAIVRMNSALTQGDTVHLVLTDNSNFTLQDDTGVSDIAGEEFGTTAGNAWGNSRPFYFGVANPDDTDASAFGFITPNPLLRRTPSSSTNIGYKGSPMSSPSDDGIFAMTTTDVTSHTSVPCEIYGVVTATKSASDDWTFDTLTDDDGFGKFALGREYTFPTLQMGADSGYLSDNGGTAPVFTTNSYNYYLDHHTGVCKVEVVVENDGGTDGSGAVTTFVHSPYVNQQTNTMFVGQGDIIHSAAVVQTYLLPQMSTAVSRFTLRAADISAGVLQDSMSTIVHSLFTNGNKRISFVAHFQAFKGA